MRHDFGMTDTDALVRGTLDDLAILQTAAMAETALETRDEWRDQVVRAGLGQRLSYTVRSRSYPLSGASMDPAAWIHTKAPVIMYAYDQGVTIRPTGEGGYNLAIPTRNVPRRGRRLMTPVEVEAAFNQDLIMIRGRKGRVLMFVDVALSRYSKSQGKAYPSRAQKRVGKPKLVHMFTLMREVRVRKRLDLDAVGRFAVAHYDAAMLRRWSGLPDRAYPMRGR